MLNVYSGGWGAFVPASQVQLIRLPLTIEFVFSNWRFAQEKTYPEVFAMYISFHFIQ